MRPLALAVALAVAGCTNVAPEELDVVDLGVGAEVTARSEVAETVRVSATHLDGRGIVCTSVYELDLALTDSGWVLDSRRVVQ